VSALLGGTARRELAGDILVADDWGAAIASATAPRWQIVGLNSVRREVSRPISAKGYPADTIPEETRFFLQPRRNTRYIYVGHLRRTVGHGVAVLGQIARIGWTDFRLDNELPQNLWKTVRFTRVYVGPTLTGPPDRCLDESELHELLETIRRRRRVDLRIERRHGGVLVYERDGRNRKLTHQAGRHRSQAFPTYTQAAFDALDLFYTFSIRSPFLDWR